MTCIYYKKGYKYQIVKDYRVGINVMADQDIKTDYISLTSIGDLSINKGYAWDGPSGLTIDTQNFMRGSLVHDALYQLMRMGHLDKEQHRKAADKLLRKMCVEDGMSWFRALYVYQAVNRFGNPSADPKNAKETIQAPKQC